MDNGISSVRYINQIISGMILGKSASPGSIKLETHGIIKTIEYEKHSVVDT